MHQIDMIIIKTISWHCCIRLDRSALSTEELPAHITPVQTVPHYHDEPCWSIFSSFCFPGSSVASAVLSCVSLTGSKTHVLPAPDFSAWRTWCVSWCRIYRRWFIVFSLRLSSTGRFLSLCKPISFIRILPFTYCSGISHAQILILISFFVQSLPKPPPLSPSSFFHLPTSLFTLEPSLYCLSICCTVIVLCSVLSRFTVSCRFLDLPCPNSSTFALLSSLQPQFYPVF